MLLKSNNFCITIVFDHAYVEPALLTVFELLERKFNFPIFLIYIDSNEENTSNQVERILIDFQKIFTESQLKIIKVSNFLFSFNKFHFSNSIIYKTLIPKIVHGFDYILNLDAGILLGNNAHEFFDKIQNDIENNDLNNSIISAFLTNSEIDLHHSLQHVAHNKHYPSGIILLFNTKKYTYNNLFEKITFAWNKYSENLIYAEQDLLCLLIDDGDFRQLPMRDQFIVEFLDIEGLNSNILSIGEQTPNFAFYKVCGTYKPWKYWVLDKRKIFYLKRRQLLENHINLSNYNFIVHNRHLITQQKLAEKFLEAYELSLLS